MGNLGGGEILVILLLALIVLGPERLPGVARQIGKVVGDIRRMSAGFQAEVRTAMDETGINDLKSEITGRTPAASPTTLPPAPTANPTPAPVAAPDPVEGTAATEPADGAEPADTPSTSPADDAVRDA